MGATGADFLTTLSGPFYGNGLTRSKLDMALHEHWPADRAARIPETVFTCWFDYRLAHPALKLHFFAHHYTLAWRRAHHVYFDRDSAVEDLSPWSTPNIYRCKAQALRSCIDTMQFADAMQVPYETFFDAGFRHLFQVVGYSTVLRKHKGLKDHRLPPLRLFRSPGVAVAAQRRMDQLTQTRLMHGVHPTYQAENWRATPLQIDHVRWLLREARRMPYGLRGHVAALKRRGVISPEMVSHVSGLPE